VSPCLDHDAALLRWFRCQGIPKKLRRLPPRRLAKISPQTSLFRAWLGVDQLRQARAVGSDGTPVCTTHDKQLGVSSQTKAAGSGVDINRQF
jgi:hypothetical protein